MKRKYIARNQWKRIKSSNCVFCTLMLLYCRQVRLFYLMKIDLESKDITQDDFELAYSQANNIMDGMAKILYI